MLGIGLAELGGGVLVVLGIFIAFMGWALLPLIPFVLIGGVYAAIRYGIPALGRGAVGLEHAVIQTVRRALQPVALWALAEPQAVEVAARRR
jgi:mannose/fructose/N-acetylgalactosamine-specific phosphotransferase system component IIC